MGGKSGRLLPILPPFVIVNHIRMKKLLLLCFAAALCAACGNTQTSLTVAVSNPLSIERSAEMVELSMADISERLNLPDTAQLVVLNPEGEQVPYQLTYDDKLIFPAEVAAHATSEYTVQVGVPMDVEVKVAGRQYTERMDDMAWENDLVGFRAYGPVLQAKGERGFGYDLFTKRGTSSPVLEEMYAMETDQEAWAKVHALRKTDPKAAEELRRAITYHVDHGYGMDCYAVGPTLGAGVAALMQGDTILYPWCYRDYEILDNGPLRFTVKLDFTPLTVKGDTAIIETRVITLDAGSHLNRTAVSYTGLKEAMPIVTGIVLHEPDGAVVTDAAAGYMTYVDPTTGPDNGKIFMGAAFPAEVREAKTVLFDAAEKKQRNNADGHVLAFSEYEPGTEYVYYWGFGWSRADIKDAAAWNQYMSEFAQKLRQPLVVVVK